MARPDELTFAPLGGVGEIGMNLSIYGLGNRHQRAWLAIDLGVSFGDEEHLPGIDLIMPQQKQELVFAPLGGVGEIGMNLSIYGLGDERKRSWLAVDLGVSFATEEQLPGIDLIFPEIRYLVQERKNLAGLILTHAHEDHYGAVLDLSLIHI